MSYQGSLTRIRESTSTDVMNAWHAYGLGRISKPQFVQLASALILQAKGRAATVADLAVSTELTRLSGSVQLPTGALPKVYNQPVLAKGVQTLLDAAEAGEDVTERLSRFALNAPLDAAVDVYGQGVAASQLVEGWVRQMDGDPCQLCRYWWREGQVWPKGHKLQHHKGCECVQRPVLYEKPSRRKPV
ncbi:hypothetical protein IWX78_000335 [Mycetocola sp. CAN_C7]|uniref:hypothetical protein n=1 Tax=Mycetocola sp. CAN_C7 TaxID=2787724 RepID=UPI0018CAFFE0